MTFLDQAKKFGRVPATFVEMDLDYCSLTYGTNPCTAAIGTTGTDRCCNTRKTCQSAPNFGLAPGWDPAKAGPGAIVNGLLAKSISGAAIMSIDGHDTGKHYAEIAIGTPNVIGCVIGVGEAGMDLTTWPGHDVHGWSYYASLGYSYHNNAALTYAFPTAATTGDIVGIALDSDAGTLTFYKNGVSLGVAFTGMPTSVKYITFAGLNTESDATIRTISGDFSYPIPAGFLPWSNPNRKTYRFSNVTVRDPSAAVNGLRCLPLLVSCDTAPMQLVPGESIGVRASVTATFVDTTDSDRGIDKYVDLRSFDPSKRSTFWRKLKARNPYYIGRPFRVLTGYLVNGVFDVANFTVRNYVIDSIKGPDKSGRWQVIAKDVLKLADNKKAQAPIKNSGKLLADITNVATTATLTPTGVGDREYAASGSLYVDSEVIAFTRVGDALTFTARGTDGTTASNHSANAPVQQCLRFTNVLPSDAAYSLLSNFSDVPADWITKSDWDAEASTWLSSQLMSRLVVKPTGLKQLLDEVCQQGLCTLWSDEIAKQVRFRALRPPDPTSVVSLDDTNNLLKDSVEVTEDPSQRIAEVWVYHGIKDYSQDDKPENYYGCEVLGDSDAESSAEYGDRPVKVIYARWLGPDDAFQAQLIAFRTLARYRDNLVTISFSVDAKDSALWTGSAAYISCRQLPDPLGALTPVLIEMTQAQDIADGKTFSYKALLSIFGARYAYITANDMVDYDVATSTQRLVNGFIGGNGGLMPDGSNDYVMV